MKNLIRAFTLAVMMLSIAHAGFSGVETNQPAPEFSLTDIQKQSHSLSDYKGKYVVLEWNNPDCPFVKKHYDSHNMQKLQEKFTKEDVIWLSINSSAEGNQGHYAPAEIQTILEKSGAHPSAYLLDLDGKVGKMYGAQTTPHMYVINPQGVLIYQGAIDDIPSFDQEDIAKAKNYVSDAITQAKAGQAVSNPSTKSYGCSVKY